MLFTVMTNKIDTVVTNGKFSGRTTWTMKSPYDFREATAVALLRMYLKVNVHPDYPVPDPTVFYLINVNEMDFVEIVARSCLKVPPSVELWPEVKFDIINCSTSYQGYVEDLANLRLPMPEVKGGNRVSL